MNLTSKQKNVLIARHLAKVDANLPNTDFAELTQLASDDPEGFRIIMELQSINTFRTIQAAIFAAAHKIKSPTNAPFKIRDAMIRDYKIAIHENTIAITLYYNPKFAELAHLSSSDWNNDFPGESK